MIYHYTEQYVPSQAFWHILFHNNFMVKFAERLKELRLAKGLTRAELAKKLNINIRSISYWETGQRQCDFDTLIALARVLDTSVDYLIGMSDY